MHVGQLRSTSLAFSAYDSKVMFEDWVEEVKEYDLQTSDTIVLLEHAIVNSLTVWKFLSSHGIFWQMEGTLELYTHEAR